jgi:hypothetical protein
MGSNNHVNGAWLALSTTGLRSVKVEYLDEPKTTLECTHEKSNNFKFTIANLIDSPAMPH